MSRRCSLPFAPLFASIVSFERLSVHTFTPSRFLRCHRVPSRSRDCAPTGFDRLIKSSFVERMVAVQLALGYGSDGSGGHCDTHHPIHGQEYAGFLTFGEERKRGHQRRCRPKAQLLGDIGGVAAGSEER